MIGSPRGSTIFRVLVFTMSMFTIPNTASANPDAIEYIENNLKNVILIKGEADPSFSIIKRMQQTRVPGLSIAVVHEGKIDWAKGYGIASDDTKVDVDTLFQAASISKPVSAIAALKLVERGKLSLDVDVNEYLKTWKLESEFTTKEKPLTLRHLLTHTGGLGTRWFPGYPSGSQLPNTSDVLLGKGNTEKVEVVREPGSIWLYSGGGYTMIQKMVEDVTGLSFTDYADSQILKPMGMLNSTYQHELPESLKQRASAAYDYNGNQFPDVYNDYPEKAAAGLWTTPTDLAIYVMHLQSIMAGKDDGILKRSTLQSMFTKHKEDWGLGPALSEVNRQLVFGHSGKNLGFTTSFKALVNKGEGLIVMSNGDNAEEINMEVLTAISEYYETGTHPRNVIDPVHIPVNELNKYTGSFMLTTDVGQDSDYRVELSIVDEMLRIKVPFEERLVRLVPIGEDKFTSTLSGNPFVFSKDEAGVVRTILVSDQYKYEKIE